MDIQRHVITYPGFAESKSAKGLYTDIRDAYSPQYMFHILPFYEETPDGDRVVHSIRNHSDSIQRYMDSLDGEITMLAKCAGTRPTVAMDDDHIARLDKLCLISPPWMVHNKFLKFQLKEWGATKRSDKAWVLPRGDAGNYIVTKEYMKDTSTTNLMERFQNIARSRATELIIVRALNDEMFHPIRAEEIDGAKIIDIEGGDHHLTGASRAKIIAALGTYAVL